MARGSGGLGDYRQPRIVKTNQEMLEAFSVKDPFHSDPLCLSRLVLEAVICDFHAPNLALIDQVTWTLVPGIAWVRSVVSSFLDLWEN